MINILFLDLKYFSKVDHFKIAEELNKETGGYSELSPDHQPDGSLVN